MLGGQHGVEADRLHAHGVPPPNEAGAHAGAHQAPACICSADLVRLLRQGKLAASRKGLDALADAVCVALERGVVILQHLEEGQAVRQVCHAPARAACTIRPPTQGCELPKLKESI